MTDGFLLIDKPRGPTSHDMVAGVRRLFDQRKVGHAGTLDPLATGLLVIGLGRVTRLLRYVQDQVKEYRARAQLGVATDTLDSAGSVLERRPMAVEQEDVRAAMANFVGEVSQVPPMHSALKVGGRRLHDLARRGDEIERTPRSVTIHDFELVDFAPSAYPQIDFRVVCAKGTYVRVLADDLAKTLGGRAHLLTLRRVRSGSLSVDDAHTLENLVRAAAPQDALLPPAEGLRDLPGAHVPAALRHSVVHGAAVPAFELGDVTIGEGPIRMLDELEGLLAVYRVDGRLAEPEVVLS